MQIEQLELHTERLVLKVLDASYASRVLDYLIRNREFFKEWNPAAAEAMFTLPFQQQRLEDDLALMRAGVMLRLHLFERDGAGYDTVIGDLAFNNIVRGAFQSCHLGYKIDRRQLNKGFMTEALRRAIAYVFDELKLHRIEANIMPRNDRSRRVAEKLGFAEEGLAHKYLKIDGAWEDHIHYVLLNDAV